MLNLIPNFYIFDTMTSSLNTMTKANQTNVCLSDFDFHVPEQLVAQVPMQPRDDARLLIRHPNGSIDHTQVKNLATHLPSDALLIINDSRVLPSRLLGQTLHGGKVEVFLIEHLETSRWRALAKPLKKLRTGTIIKFPADLCARVESRDETTAIIDLSLGYTELLSWLEQNAYVPLPPYIRRNNPIVAARSPDRDAYQTIYANESGSVAAPTAGLHFTEHLLAKLKEIGVEFATVRLHVGAGTFLPVKVDDINQHTMHTERIFVPNDTLTKLFIAQDQGRPVIAVGTTSLRSLETIFQAGIGQRDNMLSFTNKWQRTNLFLKPSHRGDRYESKLINGLWTNFHQPRSTLFMLVSALLGLDEAHRVYQKAIENNYRLFSYGDASLLWLNGAFRQET